MRNESFIVYNYKVHFRKVRNKVASWPPSTIKAFIKLNLAFVSKFVAESLKVDILHYSLKTRLKKL